jgi:hypothetical protein
MTSNGRHRRMDAARVRAELTVHDLWLRYVALGGTGDAFDLDGYLQGLVPLQTFQQDVLAQALNEALGDCYRTYLVPLSTASPVAGVDDGLERLIDALLGGRRAPGSEEAERPGPDPT